MAKKRKIAQVNTRRKKSHRLSSRTLAELIRQDFEKYSGQKITASKSKSKKPKPKGTRNYTRYSDVLATSRRLGGDYLIKRYYTRLAKRLWTKLSESTLQKIKRILLTHLTKQYAKLSPSFNDLFFLRIGYNYRLGDSLEHSYFALPIQEVADLTDLSILVEETLLGFLSQLEVYESMGFDAIKVDSTVFQSYELV